MASVKSEKKKAKAPGFFIHPESKALVGKGAGKGRPSKKQPKIRVASNNMHPHSKLLHQMVVRVQREQAERKAAIEAAYREMKDPKASKIPKPDEDWEKMEVPRSMGLDLGTVRSMMSPTHEYEFRLPISDSTIVISSNTSTALIGFTPTASPEWSGILDALFDEYRVDKLVVEYFPMIFNASTALFDRGCFHVGTDFDRTSGAPATAAEVDQFSDSKVYPAMMQSASAYFISNSWKHQHTSVVPRQVAVEGSITTVEWLPVGQIWPGGQLFYAMTTGTNSVVTCSFTKYIYVRMRMRR